MPRLTATTSRIFAALADGPATTAELAERLRLKTGQTSAAIGRLIAQHQVLRIDSGKQIAVWARVDRCDGRALMAAWKDPVAGANQQ